MVEKTAGCLFTIQECSRLKSYGIQISMGGASLPEEYRICERVLEECQIREIHRYTSRCCKRCAARNRAGLVRAETDCVH
jgi:hypothetical protein